MSAANFYSMEDFPLIVFDTDKQCKVCPLCHLGGLAEDATECEICGADLSDVEPVYDEFLAEDTYREMELYANEINKDVNSKFYNVEVRSGYYTGLQFYVDDRYGDLEGWDDEDCEYEFDMTKEEAIAKREAACDKICELLVKAKDELGCIELGVSARFSNGETMYSKL